MIDIINNVFSTYICLYRISLIIVIIFQWFVLSYIDRIHFRTRTRKLGVHISNIIAYLMIKKYIYNYFRLYIIRPLCVILESICGFMEGIENFDPIIVISDNISYDNNINHIGNTKTDNNINKVVDNINNDNIHSDKQNNSSDMIDDSDDISNTTDTTENESTYDSFDNSSSYIVKDNVSVTENTDDENETNNSNEEFDNDGNIDNSDDNNINHNDKKTSNDIDLLDLDKLDVNIDLDTIESHTQSLKVIKNREQECTDSESSYQKARKRRKIPIRLARRRYNNM